MCSHRSASEREPRCRDFSGLQSAGRVDRLDLGCRLAERKALLAFQGSALQ
jgi:hypothetical protein